MKIFDTRQTRILLNRKSNGRYLRQKECWDLLEFVVVPLIYEQKPLIIYLCPYCNQYHRMDDIPLYYAIAN